MVIRIRSIRCTITRYNGCIRELIRKVSQNLMQVYQSFKNDEELPNEIDIRKFKFKAWKNVVTLAFAFLLLFTAFSPTADLQSSINKSLGIVGLWTIYATALLSCLLVPSFAIKHLGIKWTNTLSMLLYSLYIAAQFIPNYYTITFAAFLVGLGAGPLWASYSVYVTQTCKEYNKVVKPPKPEATIPLFFGVWSCIFTTSKLIGSFISSHVLSNVKKNNTELPTSDFNSCGVDYCPAEQQPLNSTPTISSSDEETTQGFQYIFAIYLTCSLLAVALNAFLLDPIDSCFPEDQSSKSEQTTFHLVAATFNHVKNNKYQVMLIPLTIYSGVRGSFFSSDVTRAFISCEYGVENVGYVMLVAGAIDAISCPISGLLSKKIHRVFLISFRTLIDLSIYITLLLWKPNSAHFYPLMIIAVLWGISNALTRTQFYSFYGIIFEDNPAAAFSACNIFTNLGYLIIYSLGRICVQYNTFFVIALLLVGSSLYLGVEFLYRRETQNKITK